MLQRGSSAEQNVELEKVREALILAQKTGAQTRDGMKELQAQLAKNGGWQTGVGI